MSGSTALRLSGADALALLHRISTNALADLPPGQARATLFCDFRGRLLHRAVVAATADGAMWLLRDDAPGQPLAGFLDRHVFRDDVRIEDRSARLAVVRAADAEAIAPGALEERDGLPARARAAGDGTLEIGEAVTRGGAPGAAELAARERARIRAGRPGHGHEIVEAFTPFEVGLAHEVHLDKGCFTGQEVLMRLVTYRSVRRRLARVGGAGLPPGVPGELGADGQPAGILTSAVADDTGWIGLAVLRHEVCEPGHAVRLADGRIVDALELLPLHHPRGRS